MKALLLCLVFLWTAAFAGTAAAEQTAEAETNENILSWKQVYRDFILQKQYAAVEDPSDPDSASDAFGNRYDLREDGDVAFGLYDWDGDGIPELFARNGAVYAGDGPEAIVYSCEDGRLICRGSLANRAGGPWITADAGYPGILTMSGNSDQLRMRYTELQEGGSLTGGILWSEEENDPAVTVWTYDAELFAAIRDDGVIPICRTPAGSLDEAGWNDFIASAVTDRSQLAAERILDDQTVTAAEEEAAEEEQENTATATGQKNTSRKDRFPFDGKVRMGQVNLREGMGIAHRALRQLDKGAVVEVLGEEWDEKGTKWYRVRLGDQTVGYIRGDLLEEPAQGDNTAEDKTPAEQPAQQEKAEEKETPAEETAIATGTAGKDNVNLRQEPSKESTLLVTLKKGDKVDILGEQTGRDNRIWYRCRFNGKTGYIRNDMLKRTEISPPEEKSAPAGTGDAWKQVYRDFILGRQYKARQDSSDSELWYDTFGNTYDINPYKDVAFGLYDWDGDGVPELFADNGSPDTGWSEAIIYTCSGGQLVCLGSLGNRAGGPWITVDAAYPGVLTESGNMGCFIMDYTVPRGAGQISSDTVFMEDYNDPNADDGRMLGYPIITVYTSDTGLFSAIRDRGLILLCRYEAGSLSEANWNGFTASAVKDRSQFGADRMIDEHAVVDSDLGSGGGTPAEEPQQEEPQQEEMRQEEPRPEEPQPEEPQQEEPEPEENAGTQPAADWKAAYYQYLVGKEFAAQAYETDQWGQVHYTDRFGMDYYYGPDNEYSGNDCEIEFALYDWDQDGIPELFAYCGAVSKGGGPYYGYTFRNGQMECLGTVGMGNWYGLMPYRDGNDNVLFTEITDTYYYYIYCASWNGSGRASFGTLTSYIEWNEEFEDREREYTEGPTDERLFEVYNTVFRPDPYDRTYQGMAFCPVPASLAPDDAWWNSFITNYRN